ncbi:metallophosphoesterase [Aliikangiella sp. IMCC44359]|uniref:metallophosphoesterase n=1 Tax=Aliikangiella sp. IMCC44359 TaxID=3459125 RepID=UPI00403AE14D
MTLLKILILSFFTLTVSLSNLQAATIASSDQQYGYYVILGQTPKGGNVAIARTVIEEALLCPSVSEVGKGSKSYAMLPRENPNHFSVIVCEALINFDTAYQINFEDTSFKLPVAKSNPKSIQVFGDTGCKAPKSGKDGCAKGTPAEPFKSLADAGAKEKPDVVLHMGDYNYRGTSGDVYFTQKNADGELAQVKQWPYDAGDGSTEKQHCEQTLETPFYSQSALNSNFPDIWSNWHDDVFRSAGHLMAAAPWIVARGNHELCSRAGAGYFYFLDPHSNLVAGSQQINCPVPNVEQSALKNTVQIPSYKISFKQLDIVVIDSANACDSYSNSPFTAIYEKVFKEVESLVSNKTTWLMGHRPIWGVTAFYDSGSVGCTSKKQYGCVNQMMQAAIGKLANKALPNAVKLVLAGHMHRFQSVSFNSLKRPPQLVIGSSGVALDSSPPDGAFTSQIDSLKANVLTTNNFLQSKGNKYSAFGYLTMELKNKQWKAQLVNPPENILIANCASQQNLAQGICEFSTGISVSN